MLVLRFRHETWSIAVDYTVGNSWATLEFQGFAFKIKTHRIYYVNKPGLQIESTGHVSLRKILFSWYIILYFIFSPLLNAFKALFDNLFVFILYSVHYIIEQSIWAQAFWTNVNLHEHLCLSVHADVDNVLLLFECIFLNILLFIHRCK